MISLARATDVFINYVISSITEKLVNENVFSGPILPSSFGTH